MINRPDRQNVILCDNCNDLAKATLEGRHLCGGCLLGELMSTKDAELFNRLTPLPRVANQEDDSGLPPQ